MKHTQAELAELAAEFDAAEDDAGWESPHPIFMMALENDTLRKQRDKLLETLIEVLDKVPLTDSTHNATPTATKVRALIAEIEATK